MRYFTYELWLKLNSNSQIECEEASLKWERNMKSYSEIFETVKTRLPKKFLKLYLDNQSFCDFQVKNIVLAQKSGNKNPVSVDIYVTDSVDTFKITYERIKKLCISFEESNHCEGRGGFDDWGYSEIWPVDEQILSHEILFASGTTILIHFQNDDIFISKVLNQIYKSNECLNVIVNYLTNILKL